MIEFPYLNPNSLYRNFTVFGTSINLAQCKSSNTDNLIGFLCMDSKRGYIFTISFFTNSVLLNLQNSVYDNDFNYFEDIDLVNVSSDQRTLIFSSKNKVYLYQNVTIPLIFQLPFNNFIVTQSRIFFNYVVVILQNQLSSDKYYLYSFTFNYSTGVLVYYYLQSPYQLDKIFDNSLILSYNINFCYYGLLLDDKDSSICIYLSDMSYYSENQAATQRSYLYIFLIDFQSSYPLNMKLLLYEKIKFSYSCGYLIDFTDNAMILGCPFLETLASGLTSGAIVLYNKLDRGKTLFTLKYQSNSYFLLSQITNRKNPNYFGNNLKLLYSNLFNYQLYSVDHVNSLLYIFNVVEPQFLSEKTYLDTSNYFTLKLNSTFLLGLGDTNYLIDSFTHVFQNKYLFLYNSNTKFNLAYSINLKTLDSRYNMTEYLMSPVCTRDNIIDKTSFESFFLNYSNNSTLNITLIKSIIGKLCTGCPVSSSSFGVFQDKCVKCENENDLRTYPCNGYCVSYFSLNILYLKDCKSCSAFSTSSQEYMNKGNYCGINCARNFTQHGTICINARSYNDNTSLFSLEIPNIPQRLVNECNNYTNCFECSFHVIHEKCSWCSTLDYCTSDVENCEEFTPIPLNTSDYWISQDKCNVDSILCGEGYYYNKDQGYFSFPSKVSSNIGVNSYCDWEINLLEENEINVQINRKEEGIRFFLVIAIENVDKHLYLNENSNFPLDIQFISRRINFYFTLNDTNDIPLQFIEISFSAKIDVLTTKATIIISICVGFIGIIIVLVFCFYSVRCCFKTKKEHIIKDNIKVDLNNINVKEIIESEENFTKMRNSHKIRENQSVPNQDNLIEFVDSKVEKERNKAIDSNSNKDMFLNEPEKLIFNNNKEKDLYYYNEIESLNTFIVDDEEFLGIECSFCAKNYKISQKIVLLPCDHLMHINCLKIYVIRNEKYTCLECDKRIFTKANLP